MFEKFSNLEIDSAGRGGEYTVQAGFGWTNGVALWVAGTYGNILDAPKCPNITTATSTSTGKNASGAVPGIAVSPVFIAISAVLVAFVNGMML